MKGRGHKITMLTAHDFPTARLLDRAGVEVVLVGDSVSMVVQGHQNTLPVTLDQIMLFEALMTSLPQLEVS
jgi:3-methyl-2-oxobutanoate hydroxymethyltransferase